MFKQTMFMFEQTSENIFNLQNIPCVLLKTLLYLYLMKQRWICHSSCFIRYKYNNEFSQNVWYVRMATKIIKVVSHAS